MRLDFGQRWLMTLLLVGAVALVGCEKKKSYRQNTPEATLDSFFRMVQDGNVDQLPDLVHTKDPNLEATLDEVGSLMYRAVKMTETIREEHPEKVASALKKAEAEAAARIAEQGRKRNRPDWDLRFQKFLADPTTAFEEESARFAVVEIDEDRFAVTIDGKPAFGVGLLMLRGEDDLWYFEWPSTIPGLDTAMPKTEQEWEILQLLIKNIGNGFSWAETQIEEGDFNTLEEVWEEAAMNIFPNVAFGWLVYDQAVKSREREERKAKKEAEALENAAADEDQADESAEQNADTSSDG